jgi:hypothetical protein
VNLEFLLPATFLAGFLGSAHCLGMCGAIVVLFEEQAPGTAGKSRRRLYYNVGRLGFYSLLGAIAAAGGSLLAKSAGADKGLMLLRIAAALLVIVLGLRLLMDWRALQFIERGGARLWRGLSPLARHVLPASTPPRALAAGFIWGALPCGLVYSAVAIAATSGSVVHGMLVMLAFWMGTMPALWLAGASAAKIARWKSQPVVRRFAGLILVLVGAVALAFPLQRMLSGQSQHSHPATSRSE